MASIFDFVTNLITFLKELNVVHLLFGVCGLTIIYYIFQECLKFLFRKMAVNISHRISLIETVWNLGFASTSFFVLANYVEDSWRMELNDHLTMCKMHKKNIDQRVTIIFILQSSVLIQDIFYIWRSKGFNNLQFLQKQLFLAIYLLTYYSQCPLFGISMLLLIHQVDLFHLLSKLCYFLSCYTRSSVLRYVSIVFCGLSVLAWMFTFLYNIPAFLINNKSVNTNMTQAEINLLIVLDTLIGSYLVVEFITSVFLKIVLSFALKSVQRPNTLEHYILGCDPWFLQFNEFQRMETEQSNTETETENTNAKRHLETLRQTIKCSIVIKRKVKEIRERKRAEEEQRSKEKEKSKQVVGEEEVDDKRKLKQVRERKRAEEEQRSKEKEKSKQVIEEEEVEKMLQQSETESDSSGESSDPELEDRGWKLKKRKSGIPKNTP